MTNVNKKFNIFDAVDKHDVEELIRILTETKPDELDVKLAFYQAVQKCYIRIVKVFVQHGYDINEIDPTFGETPLMHATRHGHCELMKYLIQNKADVNKKSFYNFRDGVTALHVAVSGPESNHERTQALKILVSVPGVKLNETAEDVKTPLMEAAWRGRPEAMKILIDAGCDVNFKDHVTGKTAAHYCIEPHYQITTLQSSVKCLKLLFACDVSLDVEDNHGDTPLMYAIKRNNMPAFKTLIYANCKIDGNSLSDTKCTNKYLEKAIINCNMKACQLLIRAGSPYHYLKTWENLMNCQSPHIIEYISECLNEIRTLKDLSRIIVRSCIGYYPQKKIHLLDIPVSLKEYILLSDLEVT